jgi:hypothetical protein
MDLPNLLLRIGLQIDWRARWWGAIYDPTRAELFYRRARTGAFLNWPASARVGRLPN